MEYKVCVIGLGYVGLPLAVESGKKYPTIGFDINKGRINELRSGIDNTLEVDSKELAEASLLTYTDNLEDTKDCNFYIVTVPTPVDQNKKPDLTPLIKASKAVGSVLKQGDYVIYESTVFPGCTEDICVPTLEANSGLKFNQGFFIGYSPERINPGDKEHRLTTILKVTSGSNEQAATVVDNFYKSIVTAGTHLASSIKVAEAAKVIENAQRDINIAFVNELSLIFNRIGLDTKEVLEAAGTKWNFLKFSPGLVGGHCIGVDPYYLTYKAEELGYHPQVILSGRKINDNMGAYVAQQTIKLMSQRKVLNDNSRVLILGITFKEDCPDIRNSRVIDIYNELVDFGITTDVYDPHASTDEVKHEYSIKLINSPDLKSYNAIILAVSHKDFIKYNYNELKQSGVIINDVKGLLPKDQSDIRL